MGRDVIIACDFSSGRQTLDFLEKFGDRKPFVKVGMELFYAEGPEIIREIKKLGCRVFLDLKLHDIPNTVRGAMRNLARLDVDMCNVHAAGTKAMMEAAREGLGPGGPVLLAVTQLTSTSEETMHRELMIDHPMNEVVARYALNSKEAGLDGVVCSPLESADVHRICGDGFLTVTPGVRLAGDDAGDQSRVTTPAKAAQLGSDYIVVGRSITGADDPVAAYAKCMKDFVG